ncbi:MAG: 8-oxo-dGTP diphosphatase [Candidatus Paceibacterota bacterium]|jgi:8-oxo-dGTP diphosphatase/8-oxo-dGTP diphosphatase/2-hydroxy-dATP diphosphatase
MRQVVLCWIVKDGQILLGMKKRGFGAGKWNGPGGKQKGEESLEEIAVRETEEEFNIKIESGKLEKVAVINFYFKDKPEHNQTVHVFMVREWEGEPRESEEMAPKWFKTGEIPYDQMWIDDKYWLPEVLSGRKIFGEFHFSGEGERIDDFKITDLSEPNENLEPH